jgi:hypothetical protein
MSPRPRVLLVSLGTTRGWRMADSVFLDQLAGAGAVVGAVGVRMGWTGRLRRAYPVNDLVEAVAARRATGEAVRRFGPDAVVLSTTTAAMLAPGLPMPYAVRLDAPAALNRPGLRNAVLRPLERRGLGAARLVLPWSRAALAALPRGTGPAMVLPPPVSASGGSPAERERLAVAYVPDPKAKGLDVLCAAWEAAAVPGARLAVFGIERERGLAHLARTGVADPPAVEWRGLTPAREFRSALRRARVYVGSARWEDFGQAPLEALADGAVLATVPSAGPFEALALARELEPALVAAGLDAELLAGCVREAFAMSEERVRAYHERAATRLAPYRPEAVAAAVERKVLPALVG